MATEPKPNAEDQELDDKLQAAISGFPGVSCDRRTRRNIRRAAKWAVRNHPDATLAELRYIVEREIREDAARRGYLTDRGDYSNDLCSFPWSIMLQLIFLAVRFWIRRFQ